MSVKQFDHVARLYQKTVSWNPFKEVEYFTDIYAHRSVLANKCAYFRVQLEQLSAGANTLTLDLSTVKNAVSSFQTLLIYFYTGDVQIDANNFQSVSDKSDEITKRKGTRLARYKTTKFWQPS